MLQLHFVIGNSRGANNCDTTSRYFFFSNNIYSVSVCCMNAMMFSINNHFNCYNKRHRISVSSLK